MIGRNFVPSGTMDGDAFQFLFRACQECNSRKADAERHVSSVTARNISRARMRSLMRESTQNCADPPSTNMSVPLTKLPSSDSRNRTALAIATEIRAWLARSAGRSGMPRRLR